jgi:hypothetical protein
MKYRMKELEARRQHLLHQCEQQRLELAYRITQIQPAAQLTAWSRRKGVAGAANSPVAWVAGLAGLLLLSRRRRLLSGVGVLTGLIALASRASMLLRIFMQLRAVYLSVKSPKKQQP